MKLPKPSLLTPWQTLAAVVFFALVVRFFSYHGFYPSDQYRYALDAWQMANGELGVPDYLASMRWGLVLPTSIIYALFGVSEFTSTLWPMLTSIGSIVLAYVLGKKLGGERAGLFAAIVFAMFPLDVKYATQLMADAPMGFYLLLSITAVVFAGDASGRQKVVWYLIAGGAVGLAYGAKTAGLFVLPFFVIYFVTVNRAEFFYGFVVAGGLLAVMAMEWLVFLVTDGNPLHRIYIAMGAQDTMGAGDDPSLVMLDQPVSQYLIWLFVDVHFVGLFFILLLVLGVLAARRGELRFGRPEKTMLLWSFVIFFVLTFFPLTTDPYLPLFKSSNYMLMFAPPLLVLLGVLLARLSNRWSIGLLMMLAVTSVPVIYLGLESHRSHVENTRIAHDFYDEHRDATLYAPLYTIVSMRYYERFVEGDFHNFSVVNYLHTDFVPEYRPIGEGYVVVDQYFLDFFNHDVPEAVRSPPDDWELVLTYQRSTPVRDAAIAVFEALPMPGSLRDRIVNRLMSWSHSKPIMIFKVPAD